MAPLFFQGIIIKNINLHDLLFHTSFSFLLAEFFTKIVKDYIRKKINNPPLIVAPIYPGDQDLNKRESTLFENALTQVLAFVWFN